jgi:hypothetical protein
MQGATVPGPPDGTPLSESRLVDAFTQMDAAATCAGLPDKYFWAGRVRYGNDYSSAAPLERYLWLEVVDLANRERWQICIGQETLRALAGLAIAEALDPCRYNSEAARVAWFGRRLNFEPEKIWASWEKTWRGRYQAIYEILERYCDVAASHVAYRQREDSA